MSTLKSVLFIPTWDSSSTIERAPSPPVPASSSSSFPSLSSFPYLSPATTSASASSVSRHDLITFDDAPSTQIETVPVQYRRADELLSWANRDLLEALKGKCQSRYARTLLADCRRTSTSNATSTDTRTRKHTHTSTHAHCTQK